MESALDKIKREIILLKNFNTYYSAWGDRATVTETPSEYLLRETERRTLIY